MLGEKGLRAPAPDDIVELGSEEDGPQDLFSGDFGNDPEHDDDDVDGDGAEDGEEDDEKLIPYGPSYIAVHGNPLDKLRKGIAKIRYAMHGYLNNLLALVLTCYYPVLCSPL